MKEIKYRAWNKHSKEMLEIIQINFRDNYLDYSDVNSENGTRRLLLKEVELMQFTNTYDDDKTEICEGDILFYDTDDGFRIAEIFSDSVFSGFRLYPRISYEFSFEDDEYNNKDTIEFVKKYNPEHKNFVIIGNKYENPELLEETE